MNYWKANPHQWGEGQIHVIGESGDKTLCGRKLSDVPGKYVPAESFTCKGCANVMAAQESRHQRELESEKRRVQWERQRAAEQRDWQDQYYAYRRTTEWQQRRRLVLKRCHGICEACGIRTATEVHHLTYKHLYNEPLFDLVGVCRECHEALTEMDRASRG